jgi:hypothetical protein
MALEVEGVVDGGVDAEKPLCGAGRFEALHFPLPPSHDLVRVLGTIVHPQPLLVMDSARAFHGCARISVDLAHKALAPFSSHSGTGRTRGTDRRYGAGGEEWQLRRCI